MGFLEVSRRYLTWQSERVRWRRFCAFVRRDLAGDGDVPPPIDAADSEGIARTARAALLDSRFTLSEILEFRDLAEQYVRDQLTSPQAEATG